MHLSDFRGPPQIPAKATRPTWRISRRTMSGRPMSLPPLPPLKGKWKRSETRRQLPLLPLLPALPPENDNVCTETAVPDPWAGSCSYRLGRRHSGCAWRQTYNTTVSVHCAVPGASSARIFEGARFWGPHPGDLKVSGGAARALELGRVDDPASTSARICQMAKIQAPWSTGRNFEPQVRRGTEDNQSRDHFRSR